jgi:DNA replicative helicase MCM subunit Mcm2 (Cdc46/Mcm family)
LTQQAISQQPSRNSQSSSTAEGFLLDNDLFSSASATSSSSSSVSSRNLQFSKQELQLIRTLALSEYCLPILVQNFCPTIFGHELVKVGFLLGLFGGSSGNEDEYDNESKSFKVRSNIHVLVVGDPGLGKVSNSYVFFQLPFYLLFDLCSCYCTCLLYSVPLFPCICLFSNLR